VLIFEVTKRRLFLFLFHSKIKVQQSSTCPAIADRRRRIVNPSPSFSKIVNPSLLTPPFPRPFD
jgi:hypothetical protein